MKLKPLNIIEKALISGMELGYKNALKGNGYVSQNEIRAEMIKETMKIIKRMIGEIK